MSSVTVGRNVNTMSVKNRYLRQVFATIIYPKDCVMGNYWGKLILYTVLQMQIPVATRSKASVCGHSACWDCGFECSRGHGCLSVVSVVSYQVEVFASG
jgi:hypothetical protein